jgi:hypothetical protein
MDTRNFDERAVLPENSEREEKARNNSEGFHPASLSRSNA